MFNHNSLLLKLYVADKWDHLKYQDAVAEMYQLSLLQSLKVEGNENDENVKMTFSLHPLVSEWLKLRCKKETGHTD
jgi:hypothetical protein